MTQGLIIVGDVLDGLARLDADSVDAVVTDPPYDLLQASRKGSGRSNNPDSPAGRHGAKTGGFMGLAWDATGVAFRQETWEACLRVLKPGGHLIAFGGGRTHHRMWCAIEDAGFEVRELVCWLFGCLSEDTEFLTPEGWVRYHVAREGQYALAFNLATGRTCWERIQRVHVYPYEGRMLSLRSAETDQLLTPNHKVVLAAHGGVHYLPGLRSASVDSEGMAEADQTPDMFLSVQRSLAGQGVGEARAQGAGSLVGSSRGILPTEDDGLAQSSLEGWRYHFQEAWELLGGAVRQSSRVGATDGAQGRLHHGASSSDGGDVWLSPHAHGGGESREPYAERQPTREPDAVAVKPRSQALRVGEDSSRYAVPTVAITPTLVDYAGVVWCITVPSGAFVARRNGKVFVTGNSGFPKSLDVSKAIDKAAGAEREVVGDNIRRGDRKSYGGGWAQFGENTEAPSVTAPATDAAKQWEGWGTALKPAVEPILLARKPLSEPTVAANVLKWGTGALAIDATRVGTTKDVPASESTRSGYMKGWTGGHSDNTGFDPNVGRWPANVIFECTCDDPQPLPEKAHKRKGEPAQGTLLGDVAPAKLEAPQGTVHQPDCPAGMLDEQSGKLHAPVSSGRSGVSSASGFLGDLEAQPQERNYADSGGASRFFFTARSSQDELLLCRAKAILEAWNHDLANTADSSSCLPSAAVVFALSDAVVVASCGEMRVNDCQVPSTGATPSALRRLCENAIILILSTEPKSLPASFRIDTVPSKVSRAKRAGRKRPTGTTTTTPSPTSSDGCAVVVTLATIGSSTEAGVADSATRFRYVAKASRAERERGLEDFEPISGAEAVNRKPDTAGLKSPRAGAGRSAKEIRNRHATVKPIALMRWLVRLVTPPAGLVLDPFCGSGSTLIAAREEGHPFVGVDINPEYCRIAQARAGGAELVEAGLPEDTEPEWEE